MVSGLSFTGFLIPMVMAESSHTDRQLKQVTQRDVSTFCSFMLMHSLLQTAAHLPHLVQLSALNLIFNSENSDISPRPVPTGQMVLQKKRPFFHAINAIITANNSVMESVVTDTWGKAICFSVYRLADSSTVADPLFIRVTAGSAR